MKFYNLKDAVASYKIGYFVKTGFHEEAVKVIDGIEYSLWKSNRYGDEVPKIVAWQEDKMVYGIRTSIDQDIESAVSEYMGSNTEPDFEWELV